MSPCCRHPVCDKRYDYEFLVEIYYIYSDFFCLGYTILCYRLNTLTILKERNTMTAINTSIFELLKIGPGPSSSHTIGPMKAGYDFISLVCSLPLEMKKDLNIKIRLFGSLSATGEGHGTRRAVMSGLLGFLPDTCQPNVLEEFDAGEKSYVLDIKGASISYKADDIIFDAVQHDYEHSNTMIFTLISGNGERILERVYFSVGRGFLRWQAWQDQKKGTPTFPYENMNQLKKHLTDNSMRLHDLILTNEQAICFLTEDDINSRLNQIIEVMERAVKLGVESSGSLPGPIGLQRKAGVMYTQARSEQFQGSGFIKAINAYALAASEENAAGHCVVTAPTCGAAGVIPAIVYMLKHHMGATQEEVRHGLMAATAIGFLCKHNASISGAEVGCQGEVGVASAMAAALLAYARGCRFQLTENAAEIAMEHHLGLTCDPVGGYVQIPCIERNAMGAVKAYNAYLIASTLGEEYQVVDLDKAIEAMAQTGKDMSRKYKETSMGGLALSVTEC